MPKLKTNKAVAKRFVVKRSKKGVKVLKRTDGQDHFNARETGKVKRNKRGDVTMTDTVKATILRAMPYV
jgi:ribosomal protein L35